MKTTFILFLTCTLLWLSINAHAQVAGVYRDYGGVELILKQDSSFQHHFRYDLVEQWAVGKWTINHDTINLIVTPFIDTVRSANQLNGKHDSLIMSTNRYSNLGYDSSLFLRDKNGNLHFAGSATWQDTTLPKKYFLRKNRLLYIDSTGKLYRKRQKELFPSKRRLALYQKGHKDFLYPKRRFFIKKYTFRKHKAGMVKIPLSTLEMENNQAY